MPERGVSDGADPYPLQQVQANLPSTKWSPGDAGVGCECRFLTMQTATASAISWDESLYGLFAASPLIGIGALTPGASPTPRGVSRTIPVTTTPLHNDHENDHPDRTRRVYGGESCAGKHGSSCRDRQWRGSTVRCGAGGLSSGWRGRIRKRRRDLLELAQQCLRMKPDAA